MEEIIKPCDYINFNAKNLSFADRVELQIGDKWEVKTEEGRTYVVKKKPKYPKTYEECCMEERDKEYLLLPRNPVIIIETLKGEAAMKQRKEELSREFWFKKKGYRKHIR